MDQARYTAVMALQKCENSGYANLVLSNMLDNISLSQRDKGFVSVLVYGTIERMQLLNYILQQHLKMPIAKLDAPVRAILQSALYQCLFLSGVPISAAINEAVSLTKHVKKASASGMVNAVLRKSAQTNINALQFADELTRISVIYCVSKSIAKLLINAYPDKYEEILKATFYKPKLTIRVNTLKITADKLLNELQQIGAKTQTAEIDNCLYVEYKGDITKTKLFEQGFFHVQGLPSQIAVQVLNATKGQKIIDTCAAPGGKSATIAQYMQNFGQLYSCDLQQNRLSLIQDLLSRNGITCAKILQWDAKDYNSEFENADAVLCDVPCSGLGIMAKKPDIRQKDLSELLILTDIQKQIIQTASRYVKKGGHLVYSTCTINPAENSKIVDEFLKNNSDFKAKKIQGMPLNFVNQDEYALFLPNKNQSDGFFVAYLERL